MLTPTFFFFWEINAFRSRLLVPTDFLLRLYFIRRLLLPPLTRSPSLSEGGFYDGIDILTGTRKVFVDLYITKTDYSQIISFKDFGSEFVLVSAFFGIMLRTINFNNQFCFNPQWNYRLPFGVEILFRILTRSRTTNDSLVVSHFCANFWQE